MPEPPNYTLTKTVEAMGRMSFSLDLATKIFRRQFLLHAMIANRGNQCRTAAALGMHRNSVRRLCDEMEIDPLAVKKTVRSRRRARVVRFPGGAA